MESWDAVQLAQPARGHFDLGTGYHGDVWLELDALLRRPAGLRQPVRWMAERLREHAVDAVNAGTAVAACAAAVRGQDAVPVAVTSLLTLGDASETIPERLGVPFYPAATLPGRTWPAARCELCAEGIPLSPAPPDHDHV